MSGPAGLRVERLSIRYGDFPAVTDATLEVEQGKTLALVGESGCGKTSLALAIARLLPPSGQVVSGSIRVGEVDAMAVRGAALRQFRGRLVGYVPQDAMAALNPVQRAGQQIAEVFEIHGRLSRAHARQRAVELLRQVGIREPATVARQYPHQLSGGMRQRVMIGIALALEPQVLVADEPTTALDVTVQAEILGLVRELQRANGLTLLWITHDMGVVAELADGVAVMYGGRIVERGPAETVFANPSHPYTQALLAASRAGLGAPKTPFPVIGGAPPSGAIPDGCPFHPRCPSALPRCAVEIPPVRALSPQREAACHLVGAEP